MNHSIKNNGTKNNGTKKFCKVCFDAGKPESVYTNHFVKTKNMMTGKLDTTCVTLLALECRYCFGTGHTVKFCPVLEGNNKARQNQEIQQARERHTQAAQHAQAQKQVPLAKKGFAVLQDDSDDEEVAVTSFAPLVATSFATATATATAPTIASFNDFPALMCKPSSRTQSVALNFATAAALPAQPKPKATVVAPPVKDEDEYEEDSEQEEDYEEETVVSVPYVLPTSSTIFSYNVNRDIDDEDYGW
jgi:hypothetical protein